MTSGIKIAYGGASIAQRSFVTEEAVKGVFDVLEAGGVKIIDTAQLYAGSEELLGKTGAASRFILDTKHVGGFGPEEESSKERVFQRAKESLEKLKTKKVDVFYLHSPPKDAYWDETLAGVQEAYKAGLFERFGLSNFKAEQVQKAYDDCKAKGYVLPTVYQGNYSPVTRKQEQVLFPTLRKLGIAFYAYSPLAGGFLTKSKQDVQDGAGRFDTNTPIGQLYSKLYNKPEMLKVLETWEQIAKDEGCSRADLAYRWVRFSSPLKPEQGDAMIIGASSLDQLKQTLEGSNAGPLSAKALQQIDAAWDIVKEHAPLDNFHG
ncbi:hypothetical protein FH972_026450 [Carpinus fangiana]|uniref:NADP-dependent oxidoreductase domain-containing protein n=1 Tax=Carpinus fangiana TaxID=176857 RepID=A0A5N6L426_9ROSI|nr:hypothetical protein FH972_026450 [Carpinus fangiana]